jgi:hypothetical protein
MIKNIKKYLHNRKLDKKIKYVPDFMCGRCTVKNDPELDKLINEIEKYMKSSKKYSYIEYVNTMNGLYYLRNMIESEKDRNEIIKVFAEDLKSKEPNIEETQNAICEAIERSNKDVR